MTCRPPGAKVTSLFAGTSSRESGAIALIAPPPLPVVVVSCISALRATGLAMPTSTAALAPPWMVR